MIALKGVVKSFGRIIALNNISVSVKEGEIFGLVGPDGAGKTTLMRVICGLIHPEKGEARVFDRTFKEREKSKNSEHSNFGYMPQRFSLYGDLTVMENLYFFGAMYKLRKQVISERSDEILRLTNLIEFKNRLAENLSGGMKQKLALTCSLVTRPKLLILDEPTYGVDPESRQEFWKILYQLNRQGMTILVSTPYMDEAELCTKIAFMNEGRFAALDTPLNLKEKFPYQVWELVSDSRDPELFFRENGVHDSSLFGDKYRLIINRATDAQNLIKETLSAKGYNFTYMQKVSASMEDVFVIMAGGEKE